MEYKMKLTDEERAILDGAQGETMAKVLRTLVMFGDTFGAEKLVPIDAPVHLVTSFGLGLLKPIYSIMDQLIVAGLTTADKFTVDPRPLDYKNVRCNPVEKLVFSKIMYSAQEKYEQQLKKVGLKDDNAFSCTCYLDEVGNTPKFGAVLSWAESSAVVYANSVLGARCNRNSGVLELFGGIAGKVPYFGLLTDAGRRADWRIELKTEKLPPAQVLGSAIGMKVMEDVPYITGLDRFLGSELNDNVKGYLKDMGAATASNGAVGLYHVENLTPEAKQQGEKLIKKGAQVYVIDDAEIERVYKSYPVMWKDPNAAPKLCFIGCPHLTYTQLCEWTDKLCAGLKSAGRDRVAVRTVFTAAPDVADKFRATPDYARLCATGVTLSSICPLMYMNNPVANKKPVMTTSNKLRTYSNARYYKDEDALAIICKGAQNG